jgi:hypothetical protein
MAAGIGLLASQGAHAQMKGLGATDVAELAKNRTLDLRIHDLPDAPRTASFSPGMLVRSQLSDNAAIGLGLATGYSKKRTNDFNLGARQVRSRKPAVTFVLKF